MSQPLPKPSRLRHANVHLPRRDQCFSDLKPTSALWDCGNMVASNEHVFALPALSLTGGRVLILPHDKGGKVLPGVPALTSHIAPVVDLAFSPFHTGLLVTGSEDSTVKLWQIPNDGLKATMSDPLATITGHGKKVGILQFHPSAENVLLSASIDHHVKLWDLETTTEKIDLGMHTDMIQSVNFNLDGSLINTTCRDKKLRILDCRSQEVTVAVNAHTGSKITKSVWAKRMNLIVTLGFNKENYRQVMVWEPRNMTAPLYTHEIDRQSSVFMTMFDEDTGALYLAGKGDCSISVWDISTSRTPIATPASTLTCGVEPTRGICMLPRKTLRPKDCEIARFVRVTPNHTAPLILSLPRKLAASQFQEDLYPPTFANKPAMTASEYFSGKECKPPLLQSMQNRFSDQDSTEAPEIMEYHPIPNMLNQPVASQSNLVSNTRASPERASEVISTPAATSKSTSVPRSTESDYMEARRNACMADIDAAKKKVAEAKTRLLAAEKELEDAQKRLEDCS